MKDKAKYLKHSSKLYKGFLKQVKRQQAKPSEKIIDLGCSINLPKNFKGIYTHEIEVFNSKWNGMNLKRLTNKLYPLRVYGGMYSKYRINKEGKIILSRYGKQILDKKRKLKNQK